MGFRTHRGPARASCYYFCRESKSPLSLAQESHVFCVHKAEMDIHIEKTPGLYPVLLNYLTLLDILHVTSLAMPFRFSLQAVPFLLGHQTLEFLWDQKQAFLIVPYQEISTHFIVLAQSSSLVYQYIQLLTWHITRIVGRYHKFMCTWPDSWSFSSNLVVFHCSFSG